MEENKETPTTPEDEETKQKEKPASKESPPPGGEEKSSSGLDPNLAAFLSYLLGIIGGIIFYAIEKESKFVKFHAMQSIFLFIAYFVLAIAVWIINFISMFITQGLSFCIFGPIFMLVIIGFLFVWIFMMVKAFQGEYYKLPVIGDLAERQVKL